jgi:hypothetical protein
MDHHNDTHTNDPGRKTTIVDGRSIDLSSLSESALLSCRCSCLPRGGVEAAILCCYYHREYSWPDVIRLSLHHVKEHQLGCEDYFRPVITLSRWFISGIFECHAIARLVFPDESDMAYAASAPVHFYSQTVPTPTYYEHITKVADHDFSGCAASVQSTVLL